MTIQPVSRGLWEWAIVKLVLGLAVILYASFFYFIGFNEEGTREAIAWSAKISFVLFGLAFSASAIHKWMKNSFSFWWLMNRRYFGIAFGINHFLHLFFLVLLQQVFHPVFTLAPRISLLAGGLVYLFIATMLLTSFETFAKYISKKQWKILHTLGGHWVWFIFLSTYFKKVKNSGWEFLPFVLILIFMLLLRFWSKRKTLGIM